jgi:hypothetical protein
MLPGAQIRSLFRKVSKQTLVFIENVIKGNYQTYISYENENNGKRQ